MREDAYSLITPFPLSVRCIAVVRNPLCEMHVIEDATRQHRGDSGKLPLDRIPVNAGDVTIKQAANGAATGRLQL